MTLAKIVARMEPTGRREAPPDDRLREIRDSRDAGPGLRFAPSGLQRRDLPDGLFRVRCARQKYFAFPVGARRKPLKPLRAGMPGDSGVLVVTRVRSTNTKCTRGRGCNGHPAFPTPFLGGKFINASGA